MVEPACLCAHRRRECRVLHERRRGRDACPFRRRALRVPVAGAVPRARRARERDGRRRFPQVQSHRKRLAGQGSRDRRLVRCVYSSLRAELVSVRNLRHVTQRRRDPRNIHRRGARRPVRAMRAAAAVRLGRQRGHFFGLEYHRGRPTDAAVACVHVSADHRGLWRHDRREQAADAPGGVQAALVRERRRDGRVVNVRPACVARRVPLPRRGICTSARDDRGYKNDKREYFVCDVFITRFVVGVCARAAESTPAIEARQHARRHDTTANDSRGRYSTVARARFGSARVWR